MAISARSFGHFGPALSPAMSTLSRGSATASIHSGDSAARDGHDARRKSLANSSSMLPWSGGQQGRCTPRWNGRRSRHAQNRWRIGAIVDEICAQARDQQTGKIGGRRRFRDVDVSIFLMIPDFGVWRRNTTIECPRSDFQTWETYLNKNVDGRFLINKSASQLPLRGNSELQVAAVLFSRNLQQQSGYSLLAYPILNR